MMHFAVLLFLIIFGTVDGLRSPKRLSGSSKASSTSLNQVATIKNSEMLSSVVTAEDKELLQDIATVPGVPAQQLGVGAAALVEEQEDIEVERKLNALELFSRAARFYRTAVPVFAAYRGLQESIKFREDNLGETFTEDEISEKYEALHEWGSGEMRDIIVELKGFYVKTGQIISTRVDIFPIQYTSKLAMMQDNLEAIPFAVVKRAVEKELLDGADLSDLFASFDEKPLGSASIAQVHKAVLLDGRTVAVKVQRPGVESKLLGDIENLKTFAKIVGKSLPIDYYKIFCELERTLRYELDFLHEAQATAKVASAVSHNPKNQPRKKAAVTVPLPIPGLVSRRVMVMEYIDGVALSAIAAEMTEKDKKEKIEVSEAKKSALAAGVEYVPPIETAASKAKAEDDKGKTLLFANKLLSSLTDAYASMIFGSGIIHGDPHPGNIFVLGGGAEIALLDCGQVKVLTTTQRISLAKLIILVNTWEKQEKKVRNLENIILKIKDISTDKRSQEYFPELQTKQAELKEQEQLLDTFTTDLANSVKSFGVFFKESDKVREAAAAVAILLFGNSETKLPGGFAGEELDSSSPIAQVVEFPQELVLLGRATVMIKGISNRLGMPWALSDRWAAVAAEAIESDITPAQRLPIWSVIKPQVQSSRSSLVHDSRLVSKEPIRFRDLLAGVVNLGRLLKAYIKAKLVLAYVKFVPVRARKKIMELFVSTAAKIVLWKEGGGRGGGSQK